VGRYVPDRGHIVWLQFDPQAGHEQAGRRPAIVLSPEPYNRKAGLALCCPITTRVKGYPFEVLIPAGLPVEGAVLSDQVKSVDWAARKAKLCCSVPAETVGEVLGNLAALLAPYQ
jgi:mRNA interferase MazF